MSGTRSTIGAVVAAVALFAGYQQVSGGGDAPATEGVAAEGASPVLASSPLEWGDGLDHYVVHLHPAGPTVATATDGTAGGVDVAGRQEVAGEGDVAVEPDEGPAAPGVVSGALWLTVPTTAQQSAFLAAAGDGLLLAVDDAGRFHAVDPTDGSVVASADLPPAAPEPSGTALDDAPVEPEDGTAPADGAAVIGDVADADAATVAALAAVPGVMTIHVMGPGLLSVAVEPHVDEDELAAVAGVASLEEDDLLALAADDPRLAEQWALANDGAASRAAGWAGVADADLDAVEAWQVADGDGVVVAVIDTGVDVDHPDLRDQIWTNAAEVCGNQVDDDGNGYVDDCRGWDFGDADADPRPDAGDPSRDHGTHVAGIVAAEAGNGLGGAGVAPGARIMALKVSRNGGLSTSALLGAIRYATANGADVVNLSLGTPPGTPRTAVGSMEEAVAAADAAGVIVMAAAGNNGVDISPSATVWPAGFSRSYEGVITVGATTNADTRASFSNYGEPVVVWAPGFFLLSTVTGGRWAPMSGTSMATPAAAGAVAVLLSSGRATAAGEVRAVLTETADPIPGVGPRVNIGRAVGAPGADGAVSVAISGANGLRPDEDAALVTRLSATVPPADDLAVVHAFATLEGGQVYAVGDLEVTLPDGTTMVTAADGSLEPIPVDVAALTAGGWSTTLATSFPEGEYALVTELVDGSGTPVEEPVAIVFGVSTEGGTATTVPPGSPPLTTVAPPAGDGTGGGSTGAPTTTTTPAGGGSGSSAPSSSTTSTSVPAGGSGGGTPASSTTTTTTPRAPTSTVTSTTAPLPPSDPPGPGGASGGASGSPTTTTAPGSGGPITTTPPPAPDQARGWVLEAADPRLATTAGGTRITLTGTFPAEAEIEIGLWDVTVAPDGVAADRIVFTTPPLPADYYPISVTIRDGGVRTVLVLDHALTVVAPGAAPGGGGGSAPSTTTVPGAGGSGGGGVPSPPPTGGGTPGSGASGPGSAGGATTTTPPPPGGSGGSGGGGSVTTTTAAPGPTTTAAPAPAVRRGSLGLRPAPTTGPLARAAGAFTTGTRCSSDPCIARRA